MKQHVSRRRFIRLIAAATSGMIVPAVNRKGDVSARDYCYWKRINGPYCRYGILYEDWGFRCCAGGVCEYETYETRRVGYC